MTAIISGVNLAHQGKYSELADRARRRQVDREFLDTGQRDLKAGYFAGVVTLTVLPGADVTPIGLYASTS